MKRRTIKGLHAQEPCRDPLALIPSIPRCSSIHLDSVLFLPLSSQAHSVLQRQLLPPCVLCVQLRPTLHDPMDCSPPGSSVHGIFRQEYWSELPFPSRGFFPTQGSNPGLLHCRRILLPLSHLGSFLRSKLKLFLSVQGSDCLDTGNIVSTTQVLPRKKYSLRGRS